MLYRGSRDGFGADMFHAKCDGKLKTLTIVKSTNGNIFGGYTAVAWDQSWSYKHDPNAFLFSLVNKDNQPFKFKYNGNGKAIECHPNNSAIFGDGHDLFIASDANAITWDVAIFTQNMLNDQLKPIHFWLVHSIFKL